MHKRKLIIRLLLALLAVSLIAGACSSDSENTANTSTTLGSGDSSSTLL